MLIALAPGSLSCRGPLSCRTRKIRQSDPTRTSRVMHGTMRVMHMGTLCSKWINNIITSSMLFFYKIVQMISRYPSPSWNMHGTQGKGCWLWVNWWNLKDVLDFSKEDREGDMVWRIRSWTLAGLQTVHMIWASQVKGFQRNQYLIRAAGRTVSNQVNCANVFWEIRAWLQICVTTDWIGICLFCSATYFIVTVPKW